jgi:hypothetical protein
MGLERQLRAFDDTRRALLDELEGLDSGALVAKPLAGKWSILEIIEHLVLSERAVFRGLPDPARLENVERGVGHRVRYLLVMFILNSGIRVRVPSPSMVPRGGRSLAELRGLWDENQDWLRSCIDRLGPNGVRKAVLEHPVAGPLSVGQAVAMAQVHVDGHVRQIRALQRLLV